MKRPLTPEEISAITEAGYDISGYDGRAVDIPDDLYGSTKTSSVAAGGRAALASAIPTAAGGAAFMPAFTAGTALSAPLGPFAPIGGVVAGLAAGYGASRLAGAGQQALMPQSWEQQLATDVEQHPTATKIGQLATIPLGGMRPSISGTRAALSGLSRLATGAPVSVAEKQALMLAGGGAALGAGQEAVVAPIEGRPVELGNVLEAAGMGAAFNRPTKFAQKYYGFHDIPQRTVDSPEALAALQRARAASDPAQTASDPTTRATVAKPNLRQESLLDAINRSVNAPVEGTPVYTKPAKQSAERILKGEQENKPLVKRMEDEDLLATIDKQATAKRPRFQEEGDGLSPLQREVEEGLKGRKLSTTPSQQYIDTLTNELLTTKNIKVSADTTLVNEDGAPVKGVALLPNAVREVVINPEKASIDTLPHEALHYFREELEQASKAGDAQATKLLNQWDTLSKEGLAKSNAQRVKDGKQPNDAHEYAVSEQGLEFIKQQFNLLGETGKQRWWNDTKALLKTRWSNNATLADLRRAINFRFVNEQTRGKYVGKTGPLGPVGKKGGVAGLINRNSEDSDRYNELTNIMKTKPTTEAWLELEALKESYGGETVAEHQPFDNPDQRAWRIKNNRTATGSSSQEYNLPSDLSYGHIYDLGINADPKTLNSLYKKLVELNPELKTIKLGSLLEKRDVVKGVASKFKSDNIKYFIEEHKKTFPNNNSDILREGVEQITKPKTRNQTDDEGLLRRQGGEGRTPYPFTMKELTKGEKILEDTVGENDIALSELTADLDYAIRDKTGQVIDNPDTLIQALKHEEGLRKLLGDLDANEFITRFKNLVNNKGAQLADIDRPSVNKRNQPADEGLQRIKKAELVRKYNEAVKEIKSGDQRNLGLRNVTAADKSYKVGWSNGSERWDVSTIGTYERTAVDKNIDWNSPSAMRAWREKRKKFLNKPFASKGEEIQLDSNQILVSANSLKEARLIAEHLPEPPFAVNAAERNPLLDSSLSFEEAIQKYIELEPNKIDVDKSTTEFLDSLDNKRFQGADEGLTPTGEPVGAERVLLDAAKRTRTYLEWRDAAPDKSDNAFYKAILDDELLRDDVMSEPNVMAALKKASLLPKAKKQAAPKPDTAPAVEKVVSDVVEESSPKSKFIPELKEAVTRRNVEPDGRVYSSGNEVWPTNEFIKTFLDRIDKNIAEEKAKIVELTKGKLQNPNANPYEVRKHLLADARAATWDEAINTYKSILRDSEQYKADVLLANRVYNERLKQADKPEKVKPVVSEETGQKVIPLAAKESSKITIDEARANAARIREQLLKQAEVQDKIEGNDKRIFTTPEESRRKVMEESQRYLEERKKSGRYQGEDEGLQTDTPEFKKWFGQSKIVDKSGKPLVVYHGTGEDFTKFSHDKTGGVGFYFSSNPHYASVYTRNSVGFEPKGSVYPVYLKMENPATTKIANSVYEELARKGSLSGNPRKLLNEELQKRGYDGVVINEVKDKNFDIIGGTPGEIIAFHPEQIKSATGNRGTFDPTNQDIRYQPADEGLTTDPSAQSILPGFAATFDKVRKVDTELAQAGVNWQSRKDSYWGKAQIAEADLSKLPDKVANSAIAKLDEAYRTGAPLSTLTPAEQQAATAWRQYFKWNVDERRAMGMKVEGREAGANENYVPHMLNDKWIDIFTNKPASPEAAHGKSIWADRVVKESKGEIGRKEAFKNISEYIEAMGSPSKHYTSVNFGALRKAAGYGLPEGMKETSAQKILTRYGRRAANDMAMYRELESQPSIQQKLKLRDPLTGKTPSAEEGETTLSTTKEVQDMMAWVTGSINENTINHPFVTGATRLVNNLLLGPATGARDTASIPIFVLPYINKFSDLAAFAKGVLHYRENARDALEYAAKQPHIDKVQFGEIGESPNVLLALLRKAATLARTGQGREAIENFNREVVFSGGKELVRNNIIGAKAGHEGSKKFLKRFDTLVEGDILTLEGTELESAINQMAKNFTDANQGTYGGAGLPTWTTEGQLAPFLSLQKWSIEKSNIIFKDVIKPFYTGENRIPLLTYTLGSVLTGAGIQELNKMLTNKKSSDPTWEEALSKGDAKALTSQLATLLQLASFGGIVGDSMKVLSDASKGKTPRNPLSFPAYSSTIDAAENIKNAVNAINDGEDAMEVLTELSTYLMAHNIQSVRMVNNRLDADETARSEKFRDVRAFNELEGKSPTDITQPNRYSGLAAKQYKRTGDLGEAASMLPSLVEQSISRSGGDYEKLSKRLTSLKGNSYQTFPSLENQPVAFQQYYDFLRRTQGEEVANARLADYMRQRSVNKIKSSIVPSL